MGKFRVEYKSNHMSSWQEQFSLWDESEKMFNYIQDINCLDEIKKLLVQEMKEHAYVHTHRIVDVSTNKIVFQQRCQGCLDCKGET